MNLTKKTPTEKKKKPVVTSRKGDRGSRGAAEYGAPALRNERSQKTKRKAGRCEASRGKHEQNTLT